MRGRSPGKRHNPLRTKRIKKIMAILKVGGEKPGIIRVKDFSLKCSSDPYLKYRSKPELKRYINILRNWGTVDTVARSPATGGPEVFYVFLPMAYALARTHAGYYDNFVPLTE